MKLVDGHDPEFSLRRAIEKQIELEDMVAWAQRETPECKTIPPHQPQTSSRSPIKRFISIIVP